MTDYTFFPVNTISLEGPDLSGKSTLYNSIHRKTSFRWDIRDRSALSRVCFAVQYSRNIAFERRRLERELCNLNNRMIVLLPPWGVLADRYRSRGDEIQSLDSLSELFEIYCREVSSIQDLPNVLVIRSVGEEAAAQAIDFLESTEKENMTEVGSFTADFLTRSSRNEHSLSFYFEGELKKPETNTILADPDEGQYYRNILWDFENIIRKEMRGLNPYAKPQGYESRRFYYSSDSCISSIHFLPREKTLKCLCSFRSTNALKNTSIDLEFLNFIVHELGFKYFSECKNYEIELKLNSAHLVYE